MLQRISYFGTSRLMPLRRLQRQSDIQHRTRYSRCLMSHLPRVRRMVISIVPLSWVGSRGLRRAICKAERTVFLLVVPASVLPSVGKVGLEPQASDSQ
jgi:hypothetical protein